MLAGAAALGLTACQDARPKLNAGSGYTAGVPIAVDIMGGAPPNVRTALASELSSATAARRVEVVGPGGPARYRVRSYLTAETTADGGAALAFVWDVFDDKSRLAKRLSGSSPIEKASLPDLWSGLNKTELARLAERSMDEIAGFLSAGAALGIRKRRPKPQPASPAEPHHQADRRESAPSVHRPGCSIVTVHQDC